MIFGRLIRALRAHALVVARCARANARVAAMTAENMQREATGCSMAYGDDAFDKIEIPTEDEVLELFGTGR